MALVVVKMMRFLYDNCRKLISKGGISDKEIGQKSGNPKEDVLHFGGSGMRCVSVYSEYCI